MLTPSPPTSDRLLARSLAAVWHPCTQMQHHESLPLVAVSRALGCWLYDQQGHRYLDAISSWWVNLFGHANPKINAALTRQLETLEHAMLAGFTHEPVVALSEKLSQYTQQQLGHCFYASDGASAVEIALKMSFHYWRNSGKPEKTQFVSLKGSYHGETLGALSVTDVPLFKDVYAPLLRQHHTVQSPDARLGQPTETPAAYALLAAQDLATYLAQHHQHTAALILEPLVQGATGMAMYDPDYLKEAQRLCQQFSVHLIADEIMTGFGRCGTFFAYQQADVVPDFLCLSKGITAGYLPLSVVLTKDSIYEAFYDERVSRAFLHSHSYTGNPLACRAALASLAIFEEEQVIERNRLLSQKISHACIPIQEHPRVKHFRHTGMIWAFEVDSKNPLFARTFYQQALAEEILLRPIGTTLYFMPPYIINDEEIHHLTSKTLKLLNALSPTA